MVEQPSAAAEALVHEWFAEVRWASADVELKRLAQMITAHTEAALKESGCGCKTAEQTGTLNGYSCPWHREKFVAALAGKEAEAHTHDASLAEEFRLAMIAEQMEMAPAVLGKLARTAIAHFSALMKEVQTDSDAIYWRQLATDLRASLAAAEGERDRLRAQLNDPRVGGAGRD